MLKAVFEVASTRSEAMKIEKFIKKQKSRTLLLQLIDPTFKPICKLAHLAPMIKKLKSISTYSLKLNKFSKCCLILPLKP